jgi:hypothetical protein
MYSIQLLASDGISSASSVWGHFGDNFNSFVSRRSEQNSSFVLPRIQSLSIQTERPNPWRHCILRSISASPPPTKRPVCGYFCHSAQRGTLRSRVSSIAHVFLLKKTPWKISTCYRWNFVKVLHHGLLFWACWNIRVNRAKPRLHVSSSAPTPSTLDAS